VGGNPSLGTVLKAVKALGLKLTAEAARRREAGLPGLAFL